MYSNSKLCKNFQRVALSQFRRLAATFAPTHTYTTTKQTLRRGKLFPCCIVSRKSLSKAEKKIFFLFLLCHCGRPDDGQTQILCTACCYYRVIFCKKSETRYLFSRWVGLFSAVPMYQVSHFGTEIRETEQSQ